MNKQDEALRLIARAVELEKEARRLRERADLILNPAEAYVWTYTGPSLPTKWRS